MSDDDVVTYFKPERRPKRRRQWNSTLPAGPSRRRHPAQGRQGRGTPGVTTSMRGQVYLRAGGQCQAHGLHHPECPGRLDEGDWVPHHVHQRRHGGPDTVDNLIAVWCPGALGTNGCHGLHRAPLRAEVMGLLRGTGEPSLFGAGAHLPQRFWARVALQGRLECWPYRGAITQPTLGRRVARLGPDDPRVVTQACGDATCVNPTHLTVS